MCWATTAKKEVGGAGKCSCLLMMEKDEHGYVHITRATKHVVYQPDIGAARL